MNEYKKLRNQVGPMIDQSKNMTMSLLYSNDPKCPWNETHK